MWSVVATVYMTVGGMYVLSGRHGIYVCWSVLMHVVSGRQGENVCSEWSARYIW